MTFSNIMANTHLINSTPTNPTGSQIRVNRGITEQLVSSPLKVLKCLEFLSAALPCALNYPSKLLNDCRHLQQSFPGVLFILDCGWGWNHLHTTDTDTGGSVHLGSTMLSMNAGCSHSCRGFASGKKGRLWIWSLDQGKIQSKIQQCMSKLCNVHEMTF